MNNEDNQINIFWLGVIFVLCFLLILKLLNGFQFDEDLNNLAQIIFWMIMGFGALVAAIKIPIELNDSLRWKKTDAARKIHDDMMLHEGAKQARNMLDYQQGRLYDIKDYLKDDIEKPPGSKPKNKVEIDIDKVLIALDKKNEKDLEHFEMYIRDSFDYLFFWMGTFEHYVTKGLVNFDDVMYPIEYYVIKMFDTKRFDIFADYLQRFGFYRTLNFISRFCPEVQNCCLRKEPEKQTNCLKNKMTE